MRLPPGICPGPRWELTMPPDPKLKKFESHIRPDHPDEKSFPRHTGSLGTTDPRGPGSAMPTGGTTSTPSPFLFPGLPSEVLSSSAVVIKLNFTRAGHRIVQSTLGCARYTAQVYAHRLHALTKDKHQCRVPGYDGAKLA